MLAQAVARESGVNFIPIQGPELFSQWLGESEESVRHIFNVAARTAPCIIFFDQLDAVVPRRSDLEHEGTRAPQRVVNQLLAELDGMADRGKVIVIGATNRIEMVDPAALRPGRFGVHLRIDRPDVQEREEILRIQLRGTPLASGLDIDQVATVIAGATEGLVGADLAFVLQAARHAALEEENVAGAPEVAMQHFEYAIADLGRDGRSTDAVTTT
jgi:transitional endoplasmic reticulum ATPase